MESHTRAAALFRFLALCLAAITQAQGGAKPVAQPPSGAPAPTAKAEGAKIISAYVKAAGGARALSRIQRLTLEGTAVRSAEAESEDPSTPQTEVAFGTYTLKTKLPNRYYSELLVRGKRLIEAYNGKSAWREDASGEPTTLVGLDSGEMRALAEIANTRLLELKRNHLTTAFVGQAQVRGKDALQVEITTAAGVNRDFFFDAQSHLLIEESGKVRGVAEQIFYSDYRPEDGVQIAHKLELHLGSDPLDAYTVEITHVVVNQPIRERVFDRPPSAQVNLPDLKVLFKEVDDHQKAIDKIKEDYAGTRVEEETEYDSNGATKKRTVTESTFFYFDGEEISTVTKKDGKPLSDAEEQKEIEKAQNRVEEIQRREAKQNARREKAQEEGEEQKDESDVGIEKSTTWQRHP
jgi:hypothetical protein